VYQLSRFLPSGKKLQTTYENRQHNKTLTFT
jgi:hypothetical protein